MKKNSTAIIGMSPWNSYFDKETIGWLIWTVRERFNVVKIMIPDHPAEYTYRALGEKKPGSKARLKGNAIRNNVERVLWEEKDICIDWKKAINTHPAYRKAVRWILKLSHTNAPFRKALQETTKEVLSWKVDTVDERRIKTWVKFLICELGFLVSAKEIFGNDVTYIYHRSWPIFTDLISGKFDGIKRDIEFEIVEKKT